MSFRVLGVSAHFHDSAAALVQDGQIRAAAQEERFSRRKGDACWPAAAIASCLAHLPAGERPDRVAYYEDPGHKIRRILDTARGLAPSGALQWPRMMHSLHTLAEDLPGQLTALAGAAERVVLVPHHRSHAASAFYPSPCETAAVLVLDGVGEAASTTLWHGSRDTGLTALAETRFPHSLGLFYSAFTQYCGFKVNSGEYKLMGLAPFGTPNWAGRILDQLIDLREDGSFALDMRYFDFDRRQSGTSPLFEAFFGQPQRHPDEPITPFHMNVAASVQAVLEAAVVRLGRTALARTGARALCLAGGVALNCLANRRLRLDLPELETLWIQPAAGDAGGALGAALEVSEAEARAEGRVAPAGDRMQHALLGPGFSAAAIRAALQAAGLVFVEQTDPAAYADQVAAALAEGQVVGHFDGRMEFGPRALGNRSILADPRGQETLQRVNRSIKFREDWRPFAPIVLAARAAEIFEPPVDSPYMLLVADLRPEFRGATDLGAARAQGLSTPMELQGAIGSAFDAVTHVDFSARLQTIDPGDGRRAGAILQAFEARTGCPMLLNTSFNVRGEPIVCRPKDAIDCFLNTGLDLLAIGPFLVHRGAQGDWVESRVGRARFAAD